MLTFYFNDRHTSRTYLISMSSHVLVRGCKRYFYTLYHLNVYINSTGKRKSQGQKSRERELSGRHYSDHYSNWTTIGQWGIDISLTESILQAHHKYCLFPFCHRSMSFDVLNSQCPLWFAHYKVPPAISLLVDFFIPRTAFSNPSICPDHQTSQRLHLF